MLGVDIGSNAIKVCDLVDDGLGWRVDLVVQRTLPHGVMVDGHVRQHAALIDSLQALVTEHGWRGRDVAVAVSSPSALWRPLAVPTMTEQELAEQIHWEAEQVVPYDIDDVYLGWSVRGTLNDGLDVALTVEKRETVDSVVDALRRVGLVPVRVVSPAECIAAWFLSQQRKRNRRKQAVVIDIGAATSDVLSLRDGSLVRAMSSTAGGAMITAALQEHLSGTPSDAERIKLAAFFEQPERQAGPYRGSNTSAAVQTVIADAAERLADELARRIGFMIEADSLEPETIWLCGGSAAVPAVAKTIRAATGVATEQWLPYNGLRTRSSAEAATLLRIGPQMAVACGLSVIPLGLRIDSLAATPWWQFWRR